MLQNTAIQPRVFIAVPSYGSMMTTPTVTALMQLQQLLIVRGLYMGFCTLSYPDIAELRNIFVSTFYDKFPQATHMLMVDNDMGFDAQLVIDMLAFNKPVLGTMCPKRTYPIEWAGRALVSQNVRIQSGFMEVDGAGGAIMMVSRDGVTKMLEKFPELIDEKSIKNHSAKATFQEQGITRLLRLFDKATVDGEVFSEDLSFCQRAREATGEAIWASIGYEISHTGQHDFKACFYDTIKDFIREEKPSAPEKITDFMIPIGGGVVVKAPPKEAILAGQEGTLTGPAGTMRAAE